MRARYAGRIDQFMVHQQRELMGGIGLSFLACRLAVLAFFQLNISEGTQPVRNTDHLVTVAGC